jgi:hypothetical protein
MQPRLYCCPNGGLVPEPNAIEINVVRKENGLMYEVMTPEKLDEVKGASRSG